MSRRAARTIVVLALLCGLVLIVGGVLADRGGAVVLGICVGATTVVLWAAALRRPDR